MTSRSLFRKLEWQINAIRHRDPLSPRVFTRLFGSWRQRAWDASRLPKRVVILRSDEIGDTVTTLTLLAAMRAQWPAAKLHVVVKPGPATIFHATPTIDRLITWAPITDGSALKRQILTARQALRRFRLRGYDLAVLPRWDFDDTPIRYLAVATRAKSIVGFAPVPEREPVWLGDQAQLLTDVIPRGDTPLLTVGQLRRVAERIGVAWNQPVDPPVGLGLFDDADRQRVGELTPHEADGGVVVGVGIGARDAKRQWPVERICQTMVGLAEGQRVTVHVLGSDVDSARSAQLTTLLRAHDIHAVNLAGALSLSESAAAISACDLFLGNDSGLQHIASSLDIPTIVVTCHPATGSPWSDNAPERFGPWSRESALLQPDRAAEGCGDECVAREPHCILGVQAPDVLAAATQLLGVPHG